MGGYPMGGHPIGGYLTGDFPTGGWEVLTAQLSHHVEAVVA